MHKILPIDIPLDKIAEFCQLNQICKLLSALCSPLRMLSSPHALRARMLRDALLERSCSGMRFRRRWAARLLRDALPRALGAARSGMRYFLARFCVVTFDQIAT